MYWLEDLVYFGTLAVTGALAIAVGLLLDWSDGMIGATLIGTAMISLLAVDAVWKPGARSRRSSRQGKAIRRA